MHLKESTLLNLFSIEGLKQIDDATPLMSYNKNQKDLVEQAFLIEDLKRIVAPTKDKAAKKQDTHKLLEVFNCLREVNLTSMIPKYAKVKPAIVKVDGNYKGIKYRIYHPNGEFALTVVVTLKDSFEEAKHSCRVRPNYALDNPVPRDHDVNLIPQCVLERLTDGLIDNLFMITNTCYQCALPESNMSAYKFVTDTTDFYISR